MTPIPAAIMKAMGYSISFQLSAMLVTHQFESLRAPYRTKLGTTGRKRFLSNIPA